MIVYVFGNAPFTQAPTNDSKLSKMNGRRSPKVYALVRLISTTKHTNVMIVGETQTITFTVGSVSRLDSCKGFTKGTDTNPSPKDQDAAIVGM